MNNEEYINEYVETRGLSRNTYLSVKLILNHYSKFQQLTIHELLIEADNEEEERIRWKKRTLKHRLIKYMNFLKETMTINSAKTYLKIVKSFYRHHEIEIQTLPRLNERNAIVQKPITYQDLPDKEIIRKAVEIAEPLMKALILFLSSTGMSKVDALFHLTIQDFIDATFDYHKQKDIVSAITKLQELDSEIDIIPTFRNRRQKTNKYFITFCTHEATIEICNYLQGRLNKKELQTSDRLFKIENHYFTLKFQEINDALRLGKIGNYNRFRGHMLRKFHASNLEKDGMNRYHINVLQGKSNNAVDDVYFFEDENQLRKEYIEHMHSLLIFTEVKEVTKYSKEYIQIKEENELLKQQLLDIKSMQEEIEKIKEWFV